MKKYIIQRIQTGEYYRMNFTGCYGHTFGGESFGNHPLPENDWDENPAHPDVVIFDSKEQCEDFMKKVEFLHHIYYTECRVVEI